MTFPILGNGNYVSWRVISQLASYGKTVKCLLFHIAINKTTSHLRRDSTTQQTVNFRYLMQRLSEAHLCYEKKSQTGLWVQAAPMHSSSIRKSGHHGELGSWTQTFQAEHVRNITRQTASFTGKGPLLVNGVWLVGRVESKHTDHMWLHTATPSIWQYLHVSFVVQRSKQRKFIWVDFMTHFSKFTGGNFIYPVKAVPQHGRSPH